MRTDGQTDMTKLVVAFRNFANALKNETRGFVIRHATALPVGENPMD